MTEEKLFAANVLHTVKTVLLIKKAINTVHHVKEPIETHKMNVSVKQDFMMIGTMEIVFLVLSLVLIVGVNGHVQLVKVTLYMKENIGKTVPVLLVLINQMIKHTVKLVMPNVLPVLKLVLVLLV